jgi:hypothetical protein
MAKRKSNSRESTPAKASASTGKKRGAAAQKPTTKKIAIEIGQPLDHDAVESRFRGFRAMLAKNLADSGANTGCCLVPNPAGGPPQPVPGVDQQTCQTKLKGLFIPGGC